MIARGLALAVVVALLDQASKLWILGLMLPRQPGQQIIELLPFFNLVLVWNRGVSFGLFNNPDSPWNALALTLVAAAIVGGLVVWLRRATHGLIVFAIGLVIGGAIGNVVDRLRFGAVVDFLDVHAGAWHWPAFNVADSAICIGVALMLIDSLLVRRELRT